MAPKISTQKKVSLITKDQFSIVESGSIPDTFKSLNLDLVKWDAGNLLLLFGGVFGDLLSLLTLG